MSPAFGAGETTFSECSIDVMKQTISEISCLSPVPDSDLVLSVTGTPAEVIGRIFGVDVELDSVGAYDSLAVELSVDSPSAAPSYFDIDWDAWDIDSTDGFPIFDCHIDSAPALCNFSKIPANGTLPLTFYFDANQAGGVSISFNAWSLNDGDPGNNDAAVTVNIVRAVELNGYVSASPQLAGPNELVTISMDLTNDGLVDATNVELEIAANWSFFEFVSADLPGGAGCTTSAGGDARQAKSRRENGARSSSCCGRWTLGRRGPACRRNGSP